MNDKLSQLVYTVPDRCKVCYTCVRECPAKAIKIMDGQAEVINNRCIACGNCIKVCSQHAKDYLHTAPEVLDIIKNAANSTIVAMVAPSFPAEFMEIEDHGQIVGMIKKLGFDYVHEVSFGADLVAHKYRDILKSNTAKKYISSDCPAIVSYVEYYHPQLAESLAPIVSPMVATARIVRKKYGQNTKVVFIGPCIAKKHESSEIDQSLTFTELRNLLNEKNLQPFNTHPEDFDSPIGGKGAIFPVSGGLIQTIDVDEDILEGNVIVADGRNNFQNAIKEFEEGLINEQHLELLCCEGCIMGAGMTPEGMQYKKRMAISKYVRKKLSRISMKDWKEQISLYENLDLTRSFNPSDQRIPSPKEDEINAMLKKIGKHKKTDHLNCGACGYETCKAHAVAIIEGLAEGEMCLPHTIEKLHSLINNLEDTNEKLASAKSALKHSEKLATMGQLAAGIAHEVNNPLGVVLMYSHILKDELGKSSPYVKDLDLIATQADRCKNILSGLLNFARKNEVRRSACNIKNLIQSSINEIIVPKNIQIEISHNVSSPDMQLDADQIMQVIKNLVKNAIDALKGDGHIKINTRNNPDTGEYYIEIQDNGPGIPAEMRDKLFEPFFTTKKIGEGTGLGLAVCYGIVKMHKGRISVDTNDDPAQGDTFTKFTISLPNS